MTEMTNLFDEKIISTDPDTLQFSLKISDDEFWYCEPNLSQELLFPEAKGLERQIYDKYSGNPQNLIKEAKTNPEISAFCLNKKIWLYGTINVNDIELQEQRKLLDSYGMDWNSLSRIERNQMICEIYFETNFIDFIND